MLSTDFLRLALGWTVCVVQPALGNQPTPPISCPAVHNGHPFLGADLFAGAPEKMIRLVPIQGRWWLDEQYWKPDGFHLLCAYRDTSETFDISLPWHIRSCLLVAAGNVSCQGPAASPVAPVPPTQDGHHQPRRTDPR